MRKLFYLADVKDGDQLTVRSDQPVHWNESGKMNYLFGQTLIYGQDVKAGREGDADSGSAILYVPDEAASTGMWAISLGQDIVAINGEETDREADFDPDEYRQGIALAHLLAALGGSISD